MTDQLEQRLTKLHGIGAAKARDLVAAGVKSPADLRKPKYFNMLDVDAQIHLKYRVTKEVPRGMATRLITPQLRMVRRRPPPEPMMMRPMGMVMRLLMRMWTPHMMKMALPMNRCDRLFIRCAATALYM